MNMVGLIVHCLALLSIGYPTAVYQFNDVLQNDHPMLTSTFTKEQIQTSQLDHLNYWLYTPTNPTSMMPLMIYLHGGSSKGDDLDLLTARDGLPKYVKDGQITDIPAYIIMPQLATTFRGWVDIQTSLHELIQYMIITYHIDPANISLTGHSMGGTGTWELALAEPTMFARIAPLSGSVQVTPVNVTALVGMPVWALVGSADTVVSPSTSIQFVEQLQAQNSPAQITIFEGATHIDIPRLAYLDLMLNVVGWLLADARSTTPPYQLALPMVAR